MYALAPIMRFYCKNLSYNEFGRIVVNIMGASQRKSLDKKASSNNLSVSHTPGRKTCPCEVALKRIDNAGSFQWS